MFGTGVRCKGVATLGDRVTYFDMSNQDGEVYTVTSLPKLGYWGMTDYALKSDEGREHRSDLRQHGWTFAQ